ncbi:MAG: choice-of-anchor V domain-containing protein [Myxococcota bacterium]
MTSAQRAAALCLVLASSVALARNGGIASPTCLGCHSGSGTPTTTLSVTPATFNPGDAVTVRVTLQGTGAVGGLFLTTNGVGAFTTLAGQGTRLVNGDVVHSAPKAASSGSVTFEVQWRAPSARGGVVFEAATLLGNGDGRSGGDSGSSGVLSVAFGCAGVTYFRDFDGDGVGAASSGTRVDCSAPAGYSAQDGDCDDNDARVKPGQSEACNAKDDDCDGQVDEGLAAVATWPDEDGDGYGESGGAPASGCGGMKRATNDTDCDDGDATIHPGAAETCNQRDDDCDGQVDDGARVRCGVGWCARYGVTCNPADCTPGPPFAERCNALDDDCDGVVDNGAPCGAGFVCVQGRCYEDGAAPDAGTEVDGGVEPPAKGGCQTAPGWWSLAFLAWGLKRRR